MKKLSIEVELTDLQHDKIIKALDLEAEIKMAIYWYLFNYLGVYSLKDDPESGEMYEREGHLKLDYIEESE